MFTVLDMYIIYEEYTSAIVVEVVVPVLSLLLKDSELLYHS